MDKIVTVIQAIPRRIVIGLIRCYQIAISPHFPGCCRFTPTCSEYGIIALRRFGFFKGSYLTIRRILRCRPGGSFGYDPVPETFSLRCKH